MTILDIHCHFFPQAFLDEARRPNTLQAKIERRADGQEHLICAGNFDHPLTPDFYAAERMLADMDGAGIEMAAISSAPPSPIGPNPPQRAVWPRCSTTASPNGLPPTQIAFSASPLCPCKTSKPRAKRPAAPSTN